MTSTRFLATLLLVTATTPLFAAESLAPPPAPLVEGLPVPVTTHPDQLSLLQSTNPQLAANKQLVYDMWRTIILAGQVDAAERFLTEGYIQHNPTVPTGRAAFQQFFSGHRARNFGNRHESLRLVTFP